MGYPGFFAVVTFCAFMCFGFSNPSLGANLEEGWENAAVGDYIPDESINSIIAGDLGNWLVGATIDGTDFCGPIPHQVEIQQISGNKILRLTSGQSTEGCSDNIWAVLFMKWGTPVNNNISIPITPDTTFSFEQSGALDNPGNHGWGSSCLLPPCYDNICVKVEDTAGNIIAYVLQKYSSGQPDLTKDYYREIVLDSSAGLYSRNLYDDFSLVPDFGSVNTEIYSIAVEIDEHGWCTIDNISISDDDVSVSKYGGGVGTCADPYQIGTPSDLITLGQTSGDYDKCFILTADIDLSGYTFTKAIIAPDTNDSTLGFQGLSFTGTFDGNNHKIINLSIQAAVPGNDYLGLFGKVSNVIKNLGIENCNIIGGDYCDNSGGLAGFNDYGTLTNCYSSGEVVGGYNSSDLGGLLGVTYGSVSDCYSNCTVTFGSDSFYIGGLYGYSRYGGIVNNCYATGSVTGGDSCQYIGGFCGINSYGSSISNCYSSTSVTTGNNSSNIGGLCGINYVSVSNCYSSGAITNGNNSSDIGGLLGKHHGNATTCFWDKETSGISTSAGGTGKTTAEMQNLNTFLNAGWDFIDETANGLDDIWKICEDDQYPLLWWQPANCGAGPPSSVSNHILQIEISTTYDYGRPGDSLFYAFDACIEVDDTVVSGSLQAPDGSIYPLELDGDDSERWLCYWRGSENLNHLADLGSGIYTFSVTYNNGSSDSTSINYALLNGEPIPPVTQQPQITYPADNSTDVPPQLSFEFLPATNPDWTLDMGWEPEPDGQPGLAGEAGALPYNSSFYGPVMLSPDTLYDFEIAINHAVTSVNSDGIPAVVDYDAECYINFTTTSTVSSSDSPDLTCQFGTVGLPSAIIAGTNTKGKVQVIISNEGEVAVEKGRKITVKLAARPIWAGDGSGDDTELVIVKGFSVSNLKPGKTKKLNMNVVIPADTPEDEYYLVAKVDTDNDVAESHENNNTAKSLETATVSAPFVDLVPAVMNPKMPGSVVSGDGTKITLPVVIFNNGNVPCAKDQKIEVIIVARPSSNLSDPGQDVILTMLNNVSISNLKPDKFKKLNVKVLLPPGMAQGNYVLGVQVDSSDNVAESDENNNLAITPALSIQPGHIDLAGTIDQTKLPTEFLQGQGGKGLIKVKVTNQGNVATAKGQKINVRIVAKSTANGAEWDLVAINKQFVSISGLKPGKSKTYNGNIVIPTNLPKGTYQIIATIDSDQEVAEADENNNVINVQALKILSAADQLVGTWEVTSIQGAPGKVDGSNSTWAFNDNGTYNWFLVYLPYYNEWDSGSYSFDGKTLTVTGGMANQLINGNSVDLTIKNGTFSFRDMDGDRWVYRKEPF